MKSVPGAVHAGETTSADTVYLDVSESQLPSGLTLWVPLKVWRGRARGHNEPHVPALSYTGDMADTVALQAWVREQVVPQAGLIVLP